MPLHRRHLLASLLVFAAGATAQVTYVDADFNTNTTHADGTPHTPTIGTFANDNLWEVRPFATGATIISSNNVGTGSEDCPMLRTRISGLIPTLRYVVYGYQWSTQNDAAQWRLRMNVDTQQPAGPLTLWHTKGTGTPMSTPLPYDAYASPVTNLGLQYDAAGIENTGHFTGPVMVREGNRCMYEIPLGVFAADFNGDIDVYVDDDAQTGNFYRNWYDGVGYEMVPLPFGQGCGNGLAQIGFAGEMTMQRDFSIAVGGAAPGALALLTFGFTSPSWNGLPLPLALAPYGYAGCSLNVNSQFNMLLTTDANGAAAQTFHLAWSTGLSLDWQWGVLEPAGTTMTAGMTTRIHR